MSPPDEEMRASPSSTPTTSAGTRRPAAGRLQLHHPDPRVRPRPRPRPSARQWRPFGHHARRRARRRVACRLHQRRFRPQPGRLHDDVLRGRLGEVALRQCADRPSLWLARQPDGVRHRRHPGQIWRQRGMGDRQRHLYPEGRQRRRHLLFLDLGRRRHRRDRLCGRRDANIDLRPATLQYEYGGGGWVSYAYRHLSAASPSPTASPSRMPSAAPATTR